MFIYAIESQYEVSGGSLVGCSEWNSCCVVLFQCQQLFLLVSYPFGWFSSLFFVVNVCFTDAYLDDVFCS